MNRPTTFVAFVLVGVVGALGVVGAGCKSSDSDEAADKKKVITTKIESESPPATDANRAGTAGSAGKAKHTLEQLTALLDAMQKKRDFDGLFKFMSKAHRSRTGAQVKAILARMKPDEVKRALGVTKVAAGKLPPQNLLARLMRLPELRGLYSGSPHKYVRADFETDKRANVLTTQDGVKCRRRFVLEDGDWRLDKGSTCEEARLTDADDKLFKQLVGLMKSLVIAAEKDAKDCNKVAAAWVKVLNASAPLVRQRRELRRSPPRYKLFSRVHAKENGALTRRLLPVLKKCARNPNMRRVLSALM